MPPFDEVAPGSTPRLSLPSGQASRAITRNANVFAITQEGVLRPAIPALGGTTKQWIREKAVSGSLSQLKPEVIPVLELERFQRRFHNGSFNLNGASSFSVLINPPVGEAILFHNLQVLYSAGTTNPVTWDLLLVNGQDAAVTWRLINNASIAIGESVQFIGPGGTIVDPIYLYSPLRLVLFENTGPGVDGARTVTFNFEEAPAPSEADRALIPPDWVVAGGGS